MTILDVAELTGLCWDTVKGIVKERLAKDYAHIRLKELRRLAIDEIYLGRKKKYLTLVIDQETGRIVWVGRGKAGEALHGFWRRLKTSGARIEAVAMDMSQAYASTVARHLPESLSPKWQISEIRRVDLSRQHGSVGTATVNLEKER